MTKRFNEVSKWVATEIVSEKDKKGRLLLLNRYILPLPVSLTPSPTSPSLFSPPQPLTLLLQINWGSWEVQEPEQLERHDFNYCWPTVEFHLPSEGALACMFLLKILYLYFIFYILYFIFCILYFVFCILYFVYHISYIISYFMYHILYLIYYILHCTYFLIFFWLFCILDDLYIICRNYRPNSWISSRRWCSWSALNTVTRILGSIYVDVSLPVFLIWVSIWQIWRSLKVYLPPASAFLPIFLSSSLLSCRTNQATIDGNPNLVHGMLNINKCRSISKVSIHLFLLPYLLPPSPSL